MAATERLVVIVLEAKGLRNTQSFGSQDPYASVNIDDGDASSTDTVSSGGTEPVWDDSLSRRVCLPLEGTPKQLHIRLWHKSACQRQLAPRKKQSNDPPRLGG